MAEEYSHRFRTAVCGFHKGDVSAYITKIATRHQAELSGLEKELTDMQQENETLREQLSALQAELETLQGVPEAEPEQTAPEPHVCMPENINELELAAYRRAEAAERLAYQRAGRLYEDLQNIYDISAVQLRSVSDATEQAMETVESAMHTLKTSLEDTQRTAKESAEALDAMGALVPDPAEGLEAVQ